jgi:hypothetical protein
MLKWNRSHLQAGRTVAIHSESSMVNSRTVLIVSLKDITAIGVANTR